jgi:hypothetical protein
MTPAQLEALDDDALASLLADLERMDQAAEYERCRADVVYWINTYCRAYDPRNLDQPYAPFALFPRQVEYIRWLEERDRTRTGGLVEKTRGTGATFLCAFYALWRWLFYEGDATGFGSRKLNLVDELGNPSSIFEKIRMTYRQLPGWMQAPGFVWSKHSTVAKFINPHNGSTIVGEGGDDIGRGARTSRYFVDEAAHLEHPSLLDASLSQTTNVRIDLSTPRGLNHFYLKRKAGLTPIFELHWIDDLRFNAWIERDAWGNERGSGVGRHPTAPIPSAYTLPEADERGNTVVYPWYEHERMEDHYKEPATMAQELDIDYVGTGRPRFNRQYLTDLREQMYPGERWAAEWAPERVEEAFPRSAWRGTVTTFVEAQESRRYIVVADTARGLTDSGTADYSVAHVFDLESCEQCAHYRGQMSEVEYAIDLVTLCTMYHNALLVVETPGPGEAVLSAINAQKTPYPNLYSYWDDDAAAVKSLRWGLPMTVSTKPEGDGKLASMIEDAAQGIRGHLFIRHPNTVEECIHYVRLRLGACGADAGGHDDEVACLRLLAMVWAQYTTRGKTAMSELRPVQPRATGQRAGHLAPPIVKRFGPR